MGQILKEVMDVNKLLRSQSASKTSVSGTIERKQPRKKHHLADQQLLKKTKVYKDKFITNAS